MRFRFSERGRVFLAHTLIACFIVSAQDAAAPAGTPVVLDGRVLFTVDTSLGPYSARDRAAATAERIAGVAEDLTVSLDAITTAPGDTSTDIVARDRVLLTVTEADAAAAGMDRIQLTACRLQSVRTAITELRGAYSSRSLLRGAAEAAGITAALIALLFLGRKIRSVAIRKLLNLPVSTVRVQKIELASASQVRRILVRAARILWTLLVLVAFYLYVPLVLSLFPWTRQYAPVLLDYVREPLLAAGHAGLTYLPSLFIVVLCCLGAYGLARLAHFMFRAVGNGTLVWPGFYPEWAEPTYKIIRFLILAFTAVIVFPYLPGSSSPAFQGVSIFLGVLFSLGSTSAVANIIAGVILTYTRAFRVGDRVKIADTVGDVTEKTLLATRIQTIKNEFITVPNSLVLSSHIVNFSTSADVSPLILHSSVTIGYETPWRQVHELLIAAATQTPRVIPAPAPFVLQTSLDDFYVTYQVNAYTAEPSSMALTYSELNQNIQDCFQGAGVEIMSPHYRALRDGNTENPPVS
ncbi:MAG: mechanosensitive ion channel family protein [Bryobacteraceae bacterium]